MVCNYDELATMNYTLVIPEGLTTVRGLLVNACYTGGDSRHEWTNCESYRQFMHLHGFAYVGCTGTADPKMVVVRPLPEMPDKTPPLSPNLSGSS